MFNLSAIDCPFLTFWRSHMFKNQYKNYSQRPFSSFWKFEFLVNRNLSLPIMGNMFSQPVVRRLLPPVVIRRGPPVMNPQRPQAVARRLPPAGNRPAPAVVTHWSQELLRNVHNIQVRVIRNIHRIQGPVIRRRPLVQRNQQQLAQAAVNAVVQIAGNQNARNQNARRRRQPRELDSSDDEDEQQNAGIEVAPPPIDPKCPICHESISNRHPVAMLCGHLYCKQCIKRSLRRKRECPLCRKKPSPRQPFIKIFFGR